jgi:hypothetical protein
MSVVIVAGDWQCDLMFSLIRKRQYLPLMEFYSRHCAEFVSDARHWRYSFWCYTPRVVKQHTLFYVGYFYRNNLLKSIVSIFLRHEASESTTDRRPGLQMIIFFTSRNVFKKWGEGKGEREVMAEAGFTPLGYLLLRVNAISRHFPFFYHGWNFIIIYNTTGLAVYFIIASFCSTSVNILMLRLMLIRSGCLRDLKHSSFFFLLRHWDSGLKSTWGFLCVSHFACRLLDKDL